MENKRSTPNAQRRTLKLRQFVCDCYVLHGNGDRVILTKFGRRSVLKVERWIEADSMDEAKKIFDKHFGGSCEAIKWREIVKGRIQKSENRIQESESRSQKKKLNTKN